MDIVHRRPTPLLDYEHPTIQALVSQRGWDALSRHERIGAVYDFVRNEIDFGFNSADDLPASEVLHDGYGQCTTKTTLLMALLRAVGVPCRLHGATIHKRLQQGVVTGPLYRMAPDDILHSWAEVELDGRWVELEGVILDDAYLAGLRHHLGTTGAVLGYGAGTDDLGEPAVSWCGESTAIQKSGINADLGLFDDPDAFYRARGANFAGLKALLVRRVVRHLMNRRVASIRGSRPGTRDRRHD